MSLCESTDVWVTGKGTRIPLEEMTDNHVQNAYAYLERYLSNSQIRESFIDRMMKPLDNNDISMDDLLDEEIAETMDELITIKAQTKSAQKWLQKLKSEAGRRNLKLE